MIDRDADYYLYNVRFIFGFHIFLAADHGGFRRQTFGSDGAQPADHVSTGFRREPAVPPAVDPVQRLPRRRGTVRLRRQQPGPHQARAHMAVRASGGQLHNHGSVPVQELGKLGVSGLGVFLLHNTHHHRVW